MGAISKMAIFSTIIIGSYIFRLLERWIKNPKFIKLIHQYNKHKITHKYEPFFKSTVVYGYIKMRGNVGYYSKDIECIYCGRTFSEFFRGDHVLAYKSNAYICNNKCLAKFLPKLNMYAQIVQTQTDIVILLLKIGNKSSTSKLSKIPTELLDTILSYTYYSVSD